MSPRPDQIEGCLAVLALLAILKPTSHSLRQHPLVLAGTFTLIALIFLEYPNVKRRVSAANRQRIAWLLGILWAFVSVCLYYNNRGEDALQLATYQVYLSLGASKWAFIPVALISYIADGNYDAYVLAMMLANAGFRCTRLASILSTWWWWSLNVLVIVSQGRLWTAYALLALWVALRTLAD